VGWNWKRDSPTNEGNSTQSNLVPVAGGTFTAGSTLVAISSFKIDKYEVTYELWTDVRNWGLAHGYTDLPAGQNGGSFPSRNPATGSNNPVTMVSWNDVVKWCNARSEKDGFTPVYYIDNRQRTIYRTGGIELNIDAVKWTASGYRLPTECEWEYAARGGNQTHGYMYSGSNDLDEVAFHLDKSDTSTHPVGQKKANELGIYDMSGNVNEWCWDWVGKAYPSGGITDPKGSKEFPVREMRGGSFDLYPIFYQVDFRDANYAGVRDFNIGFRCVQTGIGGASNFPTNPNPSILVTDQPTSLTLSWACTDPKGYALTFDIYFDTSNPPTTLIVKDYSSMSIPQSGLKNGTDYYWKVVAKNSKGQLTSGPMWKFTTISVIIPETVPVEGGTFTAGSTPVAISSFKMDKYEVTYELWTEVRNWGLAHGYTDLPAGQNGGSYHPSGKPATESNNPVTKVNWYDVVKWCNARSEKDGLTPVYYTNSTQGTIYRTGQIDINIDAVKWTAKGYRLPTECEWEYAARGGNQTHGYIYSGSNDLDEVAWYEKNSGFSTHQVGQKKANELGIYNMAGNVSEWCWDWHDDEYPSGGTTDPKGPTTTQDFRLLRGNSFIGGELSSRVNDRSSYYPVTRDDDYGFRCVRD
jgi:formylglycine-generating enzyme required for sulfatase activity